MSLLTKWKPFGRSEEIDIFRPLSSRQDPFRDMEEMVRGMQRALSGWQARPEDTSALSDWSPSVDIGETDHEFLVKAELPDVKKEDIKVTVQDNTLSISGERKMEKEEEGLRFHRMERSYGRFERSFSLPETTDSEKIRSEFKDGILTVYLPKNPEAKAASQTIPVD